ncbi:MAG TPA: alpha-E domain-containing protein [Panacibacter sp.]|nr:alpha-E domain-containing protein [Panacibacter sp.]
MLSRIADSLFWLNRYMERADGLLRVMKTNYILSLDKGTNSNLTWKPVLEIFAHANEEQSTLLENDTQSALKLLLTDMKNVNSLKVILTKARENARGVQDHITKEVWEQVNQMYHLVNQPNLTEKLTGYEAMETMEDFVKECILFSGVTDTTMPRGIGWSFMNLGRYIERCTQTIEMADQQYSSIDYNLDNAVDIIEWRYLLFSLSGYELHLKTYRGSNYNSNVLHQVLINQNFTRSVFYSLHRIERYLDDIVKENKSAENEALQRYFGRLYSDVKYVDFDTLNGITLQHWLEEVRNHLLGFSNRLAQNFFSYT